MKILWLCNGCVSSASMEYGIENGGISWIDSILEAITKQDTINLSVAFPITSDEKVVKKEILPHLNQSDGQDFCVL